jgi:hypothetical protein
MTRMGNDVLRAALQAVVVPAARRVKSSWPTAGHTAASGSVEPVDAPSPPEFGPGGYLPERAARRARKIVLRAPLGLQWVVASLVAGAVLLAAGVLLLGRGTEGPQAPWVTLGPVARLEASAVDPSTGLLVVTVGGRLRAFDAPDGVAYCAPSNRLEHPDGRVWALTGRGYAGTTSLVPVPTVTVAGEAFLDPTVRGAALDAFEEAAVPGC